MRLTLVAILSAAAAALLTLPADAASKKRSAYAAAQSPQVVRGEAGVVVRRSRTRVTVTRRSYLDPGTEVYPGSLSSRDYVFPPNTMGPAEYYIPNEAARSSLPPPLWLRAYHSPSWGY